MPYAWLLCCGGKRHTYSKMPYALPTFNVFVCLHSYCRNFKSSTNQFNKHFEHLPNLRKYNKNLVYSSFKMNATLYNTCLRVCYLKICRFSVFSSITLYVSSWTFSGESFSSLVNWLSLRRTHYKHLLHFIGLLIVEAAVVNWKSLLLIRWQTFRCDCLYIATPIRNSHVRIIAFSAHLQKVLQKIRSKTGVQTGPLLGWSFNCLIWNMFRHILTWNICTNRLLL